MPKGIVRIKIDGELEYHAKGGNAGGYDTLCGLDGEDRKVSSRVPRDAKITCRSCISIWREAHEVPRDAFDEDTISYYENLHSLTS